MEARRLIVNWGLYWLFLHIARSSDVKIFSSWRSGATLDANGPPFLALKGLCGFIQVVFSTGNSRGNSGGKTRNETGKAMYRGSFDFEHTGDGRFQ